jgi:hypothetical protein
MTAFILLRFLDVVSTLLSVEAHGLAVEVNPISRWLIANGWFVVAQVMITLIVYTIYRLEYRPFNLSIKIFNIITLAVVSSNFISYFIGIYGS